MLVQECMQHMDPVLMGVVAKLLNLTFPLLVFILDSC